MLSSLEDLAKKHYENFPVGSRFVPKRYRKPVHLIYAFARTADDIADEGTMAPEERIAKIDQWQHSLEIALQGTGSETFFIDLAYAVHTFKLSPELLTDLLVAFRRDSTNPTYNSFDDLLGYCRFSANPIGRLLLQIFECSNDRTAELSDYICTALQLTNFWQDISVDTGKNRFYIPLSEMRDFGLENETLLAKEHQEAFCELIKKQVLRTKELFRLGEPLLDLAAKDLRFELALIWHGGMRILEKIEQQNFDTRNVRPTLNALDTARIFLRALNR